MKTMKKALALVLVLTMLLTLAACGKKDKEGDKSTPTIESSATTTTTTTTTTDGGLLPDDERDGSKELPFEIGGALEFDAVVKAGGITYYDVYRVDGTILTIESKDATVEYEGKTYEPKDGVISFPVSSDDILNPVKLAIGNKGTSDATFKVTFTYPKGTKLNPIELTAGDLTTDLKAGNDQGLIYLYTATESGTLSVYVASATKGVTYDVSLFNLNTSASRTLEEDGEEKDGKKTVSVEVNKGDKVEVTIATLMNDKNEYPAATLKSKVSFVAGEVSVQPVDMVYSVTVKDDKGAAMAGVKLNFNVGGKTASATTDKNGVATATFPAADGMVTVTIPEGYSGSLTHGLSVVAPSVTITLTKEAVDEPVDPPSATMDYTVTLQDGSGAPMGGLTVTFYSGDKQVAQKVGDKKGVSKVTLDSATYTVKVEGTELRYDEKAAVVSVNKPSITLTLAADLDTAKTVRITDPLTDKLIKIPYLTEGAAYVTLKAGERNYFAFEPTRDGTFRLASSNTYARIGHFGSDMFVFTTSVAEVSGNAFNLSVRETELGNVFVVGIDAATNCEAAVVQITRIGDPAWSIEDEPTVEYKGNGAPKPITAPSGLTDLDIKSSATHQFVYNAKDGYYHLDSQNGPVVYVHMDSPYASIQGMLTEFGNMTAYLYNADGTFKSKEQYAPLMQQYVNNMDKNQKVYPLTQDLKYMLDNYGNSQNWWNEGEPGYLFEEVEGVNPASAWMFLYCYKK